MIITPVFKGFAHQSWHADPQRVLKSGRVTHLQAAARARKIEDSAASFSVGLFLFAMMGIGLPFSYLFRR